MAQAYMSHMYAYSLFTGIVIFDMSWMTKGKVFVLIAVRAFFYAKEHTRSDGTTTWTWTLPWLWNLFETSAVRNYVGNRGMARELKSNE
jgi:hypothetical protein